MLATVDGDVGGGWVDELVSVLVALECGFGKGTGMST